MKKRDTKFDSAPLYPTLEDTSVLFRYYHGEYPYIKSFLSHYSNLHTHQLIGIVQSERDANNLEKIFRECKNSTNTDLITIRMPENLGTNQCLRKINLKKIPNAAKWTLNVDSDEFIFLKKHAHSDHKKVKLFSDLVPRSFDRINLKWVMVAFGSKSSIRKGIQWNIGKDIAITKNIIDLPNVHIFNTLNPSQESPTHKFEINFPVGIAHHWGRSIEDTLIKIGFQKEKLKNAKNNDFTSIDEFLSANELPARLRFMAFLESLPANIDIAESDHKQLYDLEAEEKLVSTVANKEQLKKTKILYQEYVERARDNYDGLFKSFVGKTVNDSCKKMPKLSELLSR